MGIIGAPEYKLWSIVDGALDDDYTYDDSEERDKDAHKLVTEMRTCLAPWQVFVADVTQGCAVGEWSGEHAVLFASGVGGQGTN
jgi:hypothetical protein